MVLSLLFVSPQFFILLLLIFFLEILSIMLFFIYQDEVRHLDHSVTSCNLQPPNDATRGSGNALNMSSQSRRVRSKPACWRILHQSDSFEVHTSFVVCWFKKKKKNLSVTFCINCISVKMILFWLMHCVKVLDRCEKYCNMRKQIWFHLSIISQNAWKVQIKSMFFGDLFKMPLHFKLASIPFGTYTQNQAFCRSITWCKTMMIIKFHMEV